MLWPSRLLESRAIPPYIVPMAYTPFEYTGRSVIEFPLFYRWMGTQPSSRNFIFMTLAHNLKPRWGQTVYTTRSMWTPSFDYNGRSSFTIPMSIYTVQLRNGSIWKSTSHCVWRCASFGPALLQSSYSIGSRYYYGWQWRRRSDGARFGSTSVRWDISFHLLFEELLYSASISNPFWCIEHRAGTQISISAAGHFPHVPASSVVFIVMMPSNSPI